jgi:predicted MFS family arabinose efflux permease
MLGISEALYLPAANALIAAFHPPESRSKAIGFHLSGLSIGAIAGGTLAGYMADRHGWRSVFYLLGSAGVLLGVGAWFILRDPGTDLTPDAGRNVPLPARLKRIVAKRTAVVIMFTGLCVSMAGWVLMSWLPFHLYNKFHLTMTQAGFDGTFYFLACTAIGSIAGSFVSDRWARQRVDARLWMQIIGLAAFGPGLLMASASESEGALLACLSVAGIGRGIWDCNNMPIFCEVLDPRDWSTAYGLFNLANVLGGGSAVFVAGALMASTGLNFVLGVFSALIMVSAMLTWFSVRSATPSTMPP